MKKVLKVLLGLLLSVYFIIVIISIVFVLSRNKYGVSRIGSHAYGYITKEIKNDKYKKGDLVIIKDKSFNSIKKEDELFIYKTDKSNNIYISSAVVESVDFDNSFIILKGEFGVYREDSIIGKCVKRISKVGGFFEFITRKNMFLLLIIIPCLGLFIYEIYGIIKNMVSINKEEIIE